MISLCFEYLIGVKIKGPPGQRHPYCTHLFIYLLNNYALSIPVCAEPSGILIMYYYVMWILITCLYSASEQVSSCTIMKHALCLYLNGLLKVLKIIALKLSLFDGFTSMRLH